MVLELKQNLETGAHDVDGMEDSLRDSSRSCSSQHLFLQRRHDQTKAVILTYTKVIRVKT